MTTLITGGGSQIGIRLAKRLQAAGRPVLFASRSGKHIPDGFPSTKFDWDDVSTFSTPFEYVEKNQGEKALEPIRYVYILCPGDADPLPKVKPFIDLAVEKGTVERFVLLSASSTATDKGPNATAMGRVHTYLDEKGLDYIVVRPTWFMENLVRMYSKNIREKDVIETVVPTGRIPFVAVDDIAQAAFDAIANVDKFLPCREPHLIGPDLVSYNDIAEILSDVLGRTITHKPITPEELTQRYTLTEGWKLPEAFARSLVMIECAAEEGSQEKYVKDERSVVGKVGIRQWIEENKDAFRKA